MPKDLSHFFFVSAILKQYIKEFLVVYLLTVLFLFVLIKLNIKFLLILFIKNYSIRYLTKRPDFQSSLTVHYIFLRNKITVLLDVFKFNKIVSYSINFQINILK